MEVEAKFSIPDELAFQRLLAAPSLAGFSLGDVSVAHLHDRYLDTEDRSILAGGYAYRMRREGTRYTATLKGLGSVVGAVHRRQEYEVELPDLRSPPQWPTSTARDLALRLGGDRPLSPLFAVEQVRHSRSLSRDSQPVAQANLDRVRLVLDDTPVDQFLEFEIELLPSDTELELQALCRELEMGWGLAAQGRSKFERGLQALAVHGPLLEAPGLQPDDPMSEAGRKTLRFHFQRMLRNEPGTRLGEDIEALHDMRVATRQMRAAFQVFGEYYDPKVVRPYLKGLKRTGRALGAVRDLDVFQEKMRAYLATLPEAQQDSLDGLLAALDDRREAARQRMIAYLDGKRYRRFVERFGLFVETPGLGSRPPAWEDGEPRPYRARHVAPLAVYQRLAAVRAYGEWVSIPSDQPEPVEGPPLERLHALRIACKRLRYTLEYFREVLGPEAKDAITEIVAVQDHLGALQDAVVASEVLRDFLADDRPGTQPGVEAYLAARQTEIQDLLVTFPEVWTRLTGPAFGPLVASAVAVL